VNAAPALAEVERGLQAYVLADAPGIEAWVRGDERADAAARLAVYARAYRLRLLEVLGRDYPTLAAYLGAARFERLGRAYLQTHPSDTPSVRWFGRRLPAFLRAQPEFAAQPELAELASWDWVLGECFDAADAAALGADALARLPAAHWPLLRLAFVPALRLLALHGNAPAFYRAVQVAEALPALAWNAVARSWLIWRNAELKVCWRALDAVEASALTAALAGAEFSTLCEKLAEATGEQAAPLTAASLLKRWCADGLVAAYDSG
jgi:hypothetical protein